ncbi:DUF4892 domain-containing protein [Marinomonas transparens]|uniref:DUF4892 domain-containing protein n=1 Tax=Marinomonas transparens TaxID=2795388 RepID=A0A934N3X3_9GAMM|nr:DUF4892 domain-containing protein [Marinomonas transparens]MBJ7539468.1 DUF4892 domain-containing protein [Marinomonas transparens]
MVKFRGALFLSILLSSLSYADLSESEPYRGAQLVKSNSKVDQLIEVPLSKISRAGRGWEPESVIRVKGEYSSSLYKIDRNALLADVYAHYKALLVADGQSILFECESRSCGSSNAWANNFFKDYLLYGADQNQSLLVVKDRQGAYQIMYINRRGAGDVMVRLDEVKATEAQDSEFGIVAQMDASDLPRIRRFLSDLLPDQKVVAFVTSQKNGLLSAIERGDRMISNVEAGLGDRLSSKVRFINLADLGRESLGFDRIAFVYDSPLEN